MERVEDASFGKAKDCPCSSAPGTVQAGRFVKQALGQKRFRHYGMSQNGPDRKGAQHKSQACGRACPGIDFQ